MNDKTTIMVVDDTPANLKLLQEMLQSEHYRVVAFPNGKMALAEAARKSPDIILLDINMPGMSGFDVCEQLKRDETSRMFLCFSSAPLRKLPIRSRRLPQGARIM